MSKPKKIPPTFTELLEEWMDAREKIRLSIDYPEAFRKVFIEIFGDKLKTAAKNLNNFFK